MSTQPQYFHSAENPNWLIKKTFGGIDLTIIPYGLDEPAGAGMGSALTRAGRGSAVSIPDGARISVSENVDNDPTRGFSRQGGDFLVGVANAVFALRNGVAIDPRLLPLAAAPTTGGNEGSGTDGGFLVPPAFATKIFTLGLTEDSLLPFTDEIQLEGNSIVIPKDESTPWGTTGPRVAWQSEMAQATPTKPAVSGMDLRLKKLVGLVPVTGELLADSSALPSWLFEKLGLSVRWKSNEAILFGSGAGTPIGAYNTSAVGAVVTVAKDAGQASGTLSVTNLATMIARLPPGSYGRSVWLINNDTIPALLTLTLGNVPVFVPLGSGTQGPLQAAPSWLLLGRPVIVSQHANTFSSQGDVMLMDLSYYQTISKAGGVQFATSMHLYFDADAMAFRVTFRLDGQPKISAPITPAKGNNKMSPFVQLGAR